MRDSRLHSVNQPVLLPIDLQTTDPREQERSQSQMTAPFSLFGPKLIEQIDQRVEQVVTQSTAILSILTSEEGNILQIIEKGLRSVLEEVVAETNEWILGLGAELERRARNALGRANKIGKEIKEEVKSEEETKAVEWEVTELEEQLLQTHSRLNALQSAQWEETKTKLKIILTQEVNTMLDFKSEEELTQMEKEGDKLRASRNYSQAERIYKRVARERRELLGDFHHDTLNAEISRVTTFFRRGEYREAKQMYAAIVAKSTRSDQTTHPDVLTAKSNYAACLHKMKQYREAEKAYREVIKEREEVLGERHFKTLLTKSSLMATLFEMERFGEVRAIGKEILRIYEEEPEEYAKYLESDAQRAIEVVQGKIESKFEDSHQNESSNCLIF